MKKITTILLVFLATLSIYGQQPLELKIKKSSSLPNTAAEHMYLIEIINPSKISKDFTIVTNNNDCKDIEKSKQVLLNNTVLTKQKIQNFESGTIKANSSIDFYIKISRKNDTPLDKWNCIQIKAVSGTNNVISNILTIKSQIPDPKNFN